MAEERDNWDLQREVVKQKPLRSKRLHSIPEVAEEEADGNDAMGQRLGHEDGSGGRQRPGTPNTQRRDHHHHNAYQHELQQQQQQQQEPRSHDRLLRRQRSSPRFAAGYGYGSEERGPGRPSRQNTKSPDSGLDCGSEEEGSLGRGYYYAYAGPATRGPVRIIHCEGPVERRALAMGRRRTLTRQCSMEEDYCRDAPPHTAQSVHTGDFRSRERTGSGRRGDLCWEGARSEGWLNEMDRVCYSPHREARAQSMSRLGREQPLVCGPTSSSSSSSSSSPRPFHQQAAAMPSSMLSLLGFLSVFLFFLSIYKMGTPPLSP